MVARGLLAPLICDDKFPPSHIKKGNVMARKSKQKQPQEIKKAKTTIIQGKYFFKEDEKQDLAKSLANKQIDKQLVEDERKSIMSTYKDRSDRFSLDINRLSRNIVDGYEMRDFECTIVKDFEAKVKRYVDIHTKRVIDERQLDPSDYQHELPV